MSIRYQDYLQFIDEADPAAVALLKEYCELARQMELPPDKVDSALRWLRSVGTRYDGDIGRAKLSFLAFMKQDGVDLADTMTILEWRNIVADHGVREEFTVVEQRPTAEGRKQAAEQISSKAAARLAQIRQVCRDDPHFYDNNRALQAEELALLSGERPAETPLPIAYALAAPAAEADEYVPALRLGE